MKSDKAIPATGFKAEKVQGNGVVMVHNCRIDVDVTVRISDIINKLNDITARLTALESEVFG